MTFCPQASCWVATDMLLAGPERALCGGSLTLPSLEAVGLHGFGATSGGLPGGASARLLLLWPGLRVHSGYVPRPSRASSAPFPGGGGSWPSVWSHFPRLTLVALGPCGRAAVTPAHPRQGGSHVSCLAGRPPSVPIIGKATRRVLLTPQQRGQAWGGGSWPLSSLRPPITPFSGLDQDAFK